MFKPAFKVFLIVILSILLLSILFLRSEFAQSQSLDGLNTRMSRVESENAQLRIRINRLENQLRRIRPSTSQPSTEPIYQPPASSSQDPMFDRLATLVIELKERIVALEKRLDSLETQIITQIPWRIQQ
jgi:uncharacterized coiled-coil protein SlyX